MYPTISLNKVGAFYQPKETFPKTSHRQVAVPVEEQPLK